jgi:hypothetical protein
MQRFSHGFWVYSVERGQAQTHEGNISWQNYSEEGRESERKKAKRKSTGYSHEYRRPNSSNG